MISNNKMPNRIKQKILSKAPIVTSSENSGRRFGDFSEYDIVSRAYKNILFYLQKGLSAYSELIKRILKPILQIQSNAAIKYKIIPFSFGISEEPFYEGRCFDINYKASISKIAKVLLELSGDKKSEIPAIIPKLFPKSTPANSYSGGNTEIRRKVDLLIIIGKKGEVLFDETIKEEVEKFRKQILFVEIENENINWHFYDYQPKYKKQIQGVNKMCVTEQLKKICEKVACNLISMYPSGDYNKLIFPKLRGCLDVRVSEQEARFSFASEIVKQKEEYFFYAVEVPTVNRYSDFSTNPKIHKDDEPGGRSGSIDLSLYIKKNDLHEHFANIEFKSGQPQPHSITKDILKLLYEPCKNNIFYHILEHTNSGTLKALVDKFNDSINIIREKSIQSLEIRNTKILFFIVILEDNKSKNKSRYASYCFDFDNNNEIIESSFVF